MSTVKLTRTQLKEFKGACALYVQGRKLLPAYFLDAKRAMKNLASKGLITMFEVGYEFYLTEEGKKLCRKLGFEIE